MLGVRKCELWSKCTAEINVFKWVQAVRQGTTNGRQNTQLEVQSRRYEVSELLKKIEDALAISRKHLLRVLHLKKQTKLRLKQSLSLIKKLLKHAMSLEILGLT